MATTCRMFLLHTKVSSDVVCITIVTEHLFFKTNLHTKRFKHSKVWRHIEIKENVYSGSFINRMRYENSKVFHIDLKGSKIRIIHF